MQLDRENELFEVFLRSHDAKTMIKLILNFFLRDIYLFKKKKEKRKNVIQHGENFSILKTKECGNKKF